MYVLGLVLALAIVPLVIWMIEDLIITSARYKPTRKHDNYTIDGKRLWSNKLSGKDK